MSFSPTYEPTIFEICLVWKRRPRPRSPVPTFELTTVRFFEPFSRTARSSASGTPESPNPPTSSDEPSTTSSTASAGVARTFELIMRDRGASEVERRAVRRMSVERIVACRTALGEGATAISDRCSLKLGVAQIANYFLR